MWAPHTLHEELGVSATERQPAYQPLSSMTLEINNDGKDPPLRKHWFDLRY
jgi:hypothetical protein